MPTPKPIAQASQPAGLKLFLGPVHCPLQRKYSTKIAPQIGPKLTPMIVKTLAIAPALLCITIANAIAAAPPIATEIVELMFGSIVLNEFAAINDEKQAEGNAANAKAKNYHFPHVSPKSAPITSVAVMPFAPFAAKTFATSGFP